MPYRPAASPGSLGAPAPIYRPQPGTAAPITGGGQPPRPIAGAPPPLYRPQASVGGPAAGGGLPAQPQPVGAPPPVFRPSQPASFSQQLSAGTSAGQISVPAPAPVYRPQPQPAINGTTIGASASAPRPTYQPQQAASAPAPVYRPPQATATAAVAPPPVYRPQPTAAAAPPPHYESASNKRAAEVDMQVCEPRPGIGSACLSCAWADGLCSALCFAVSCVGCMNCIQVKFYICNCKVLLSVVITCGYVALQGMPSQRPHLNGTNAIPQQV